MLEEVPFRPFIVVTSAGKQYQVKSLDHISLGPAAKQVGIWHDDGTISVLSPLHIVAIEKEAAMS